MKLLNETQAKIEKIDYSSLIATQKRLDNLTKPLGSLGALEEIAKQIVAITRVKNPQLNHKVIFTMVADHGVVDEGVSAYPKEVTAQMVYNFLNKGAAINVLARHGGARVVVVDMGVACDLDASSQLIVRKVNYGTANMLKGASMTKEEAVKSIEAGIEIFEGEFKKGISIVGTGEMGIGNTTSASAITAAITGSSVEMVTGKGAGLDDEGLAHKVEVIKGVLAINNPNSDDAIDVLSKVGGFEIGGLVGVILGGALRKIPVVIDGFISGAAALIAYKLEPKTRDYMIAAHCSMEKGHRIILDFLRLRPVLDLNLRLGEGTGGALAMSIIEASVKILNEMATFESAGVSEKTDKQDSELVS